MEKKAKAPAEVNVDQFAGVIASMSRFLTRLASVQAFKEAKLGLAEWSVLSTVSSIDEPSNKQIAKKLGITGQRVNQITDSLSGAGLISVGPAADDGRKSLIAITDAGKTQLADLNTKLTQTIKSTLNGKEGSIVKLGKSLKVVGRLVAEDETPEAKAKKAEKKAKKADKKKPKAG